MIDPRLAGLLARIARTDAAEVADLIAQYTHDAGRWLRPDPVRPDRQLICLFGVVATGADEAEVLRAWLDAAHRVTAGFWRGETHEGAGRTQLEQELQDLVLRIAAQQNRPMLQVLADATETLLARLDALDPAATAGLVQDTVQRAPARGAIGHRYPRLVYRRD